jgi:hypothetical protein
MKKPVKAVDIVAIDNNQWKVEKKDFVEELTRRGLNIAMLSDLCISDAMSLSYKIATLWNMKGFENHAYRQEFINCVAFDIGCLLIDTYYLITSCEREPHNDLDSSYPAILIRLIYNNYYLANDRQKEFFDRNIHYYQTLITDVMDDNVIAS